jgi:uncharacterized protein YybS (DUF2232 family)
MNNRTTDTKSIVEAGLNAALIAVIMLMNTYVPAFSMVGTFLLPIPVTILFIRHNLKVTISAIFVSAVLAAILISPLPALTSSVLYGLTGISLGYCIKKDIKVSSTLGLMTIASAIGVVFSWYVLAYLVHRGGVVGVVEEAVKALQESMRISVEFYKSMGLNNAQTEQMLKMFDLFTVDNLLLMIPGLIIIGAFFSSYINYIITKAILKRFRYSMRDMTPFDKVYIDNRLGALLLMFYLLGIILSAREIKAGQYIVTSSIMILNMVFTVVGLAVVIYFLKNKYRVPKGLMIAIVVFAMMSPQLGMIFVYAGFADMFFDFRKLDPNRLFGRRQNK